MANRGVLRTNVRTELQESTAGFWTDAELNTWLDEAHADLVAATKQEATSQATLTPGVESYSTPADFYMARKMEIQSSAGSASNWTNVLPYSLDLRRPADPVSSATTTGVPDGWYVFNNRVYFVPAPDLAYVSTMYYYKNATAWSADSDVPSYPEGVLAARFDRLLVLYTCAMALRKRQDSAYTTYSGDYNAGLAAITRDALDRGSAAPLLVVDDWADE